MRNRLVAALEIALWEPSLAVELDGDGPSFCAGGDLDEFGTASDLAAAHLIRVLASPAALVFRLASRTTAYLHGTCVGAGIEIPAFAGRVVADPHTTFRLPEIAMGLIPGAGGTVSLPARIGRQRVLWMALTGAAIDADTALEWGLVDEVSVRGS
jgi:enoyl-CoA hydratase/carnithine racemase